MGYNHIKQAATERHVTRIGGLQKVALLQLWSKASTYQKLKTVFEFEFEFGNTEFESVKCSVLQEHIPDHFCFYCMLI